MKKMTQAMLQNVKRLACAATDPLMQASTLALLIGVWCTADGTEVCRFRLGGEMEYRGRYGRYAVDAQDCLVLFWKSGETTVLIRNAADPAVSYAVTRHRLLIFGESLIWKPKLRD